MALPSSIEAVDFSGLPLRLAASRRVVIEDLFADLASARAVGDERFIAHIRSLLVRNLEGLEANRAAWAARDPWMVEMYDPAPASSMDRHPEHRRGINPRNERPGSVRRSY